MSCTPDKALITLFSLVQHNQREANRKCVSRYFIVNVFFSIVLFFQSHRGFTTVKALLLLGLKFRIVVWKRDRYRRRPPVERRRSWQSTYSDCISIWARLYSKKSERKKVLVKEFDPLDLSKLVLLIPRKAITASFTTTLKSLRFQAHTRSMRAKNVLSKLNTEFSGGTDYN